MSATFNDQNTDRLTRTLTGSETLTYTGWKLITLWAKWVDDTEFAGWPVVVNPATETARIGIDTNTNLTPRGYGNFHNNQLKRTDYSSSMTNNVWHFLGLLVGPSGGDQSVDICLDGSWVTGTNSNTSAQTEDFSILTIGNGDSPSNANSWEGNIADVALWNAADETEATTIVSQLYNGGSGKEADNISAASPDWYAKLTDTSQLVAAVGGSLTNVGSVSFVSDHPALISSGGVSTVQHVAHFV